MIYICSLAFTNPDFAQHRRQLVVVPASWKSWLTTNYDVLWVIDNIYRLLLVRLPQLAFPTADTGGRHIHRLQQMWILGTLIAFLCEHQLLIFFCQEITKVGSLQSELQNFNLNLLIYRKLKWYNKANMGELMLGKVPQLWPFLAHICICSLWS
jgi:hypothetical protein